MTSPSIESMLNAQREQRQPSADRPAPPPPAVDEWLRIAAQLPMGPDGADARDAIFASADADSDGTLTLDEAQNAMPGLLGIEAALWGAALSEIVAVGFSVVSDVFPEDGSPSGVSREAFWKLCVYLRRHCEITSALGYAWTVGEYDEVKVRSRQDPTRRRRAMTCKQPTSLEELTKSARSLPANPWYREAVTRCHLGT